MKEKTVIAGSNVWFLSSSRFTLLLKLSAFIIPVYKQKIKQKNKIKNKIPDNKKILTTLFTLKKKFWIVCLFLEGVLLNLF